MDRFFQYLSTLPMPLWLAMIFAPRHRWTKRAADSEIFVILAAINYLISIFIGLGKGNKLESPVDFMSLDGVHKLMGSRPGVLGAWSHALALDLFTGVWIYRQCLRLNAPDWIRIPALLFTYVSGPVGLLLFILWRLMAGSRASSPSTQTE